jgi:hypothetical protein
MADLPFWGLGTTAWTAVAALVALAIAVGILDGLRTFIRKPRLQIQFDNRSRRSSLFSSWNGVHVLVSLLFHILRAALFGRFDP